MLDPYRACVGLAAAAVARGTTIYERSPVRRITFTRRHATVFSTGGAIKASRVVIATGMPTKLFASLERHFWFRDVVLRAHRTGAGKDSPAAGPPHPRRA